MKEANPINQGDSSTELDVIIEEKEEEHELQVHARLIFSKEQVINNLSSFLASSGNTLKGSVDMMSY